MIIKKCLKCGALVEVLDDCNCANCGIKCCNQQMEIMEPQHNSQIQNDFVIENTNTEFIISQKRENGFEWVIFETNDIIGKKRISPQKKVVFPKLNNSCLYVYNSNGDIYQLSIK